MGTLSSAWATSWRNANSSSWYGTRREIGPVAAAFE